MEIATVKKSTASAIDNLEDHWKRIDEIQSAKEYCAHRPKNSVTVEEFGARYGVGRQVAYKRLNEMVADKRMKKVRCLLATPSGMRAGSAYILAR